MKALTLLAISVLLSGCMDTTPETKPATQQEPEPPLPPPVSMAAPVRFGRNVVHQLEQQKERAVERERLFNECLDDS